MEVSPRKCAPCAQRKSIQLHPSMLRQSLRGEVDTVQCGVHIRNQDVLRADNAVTALSYSQGVGEYLEIRKATLKALFHAVSLKRELVKSIKKFQYYIHLLSNFLRMW